MKKFLMAISVLAAFSLNMNAANDIWGNNNDNTNNESAFGGGEIFSDSPWLSTRPGEVAGGDGTGTNGELETNDPKAEVPVGSGLLVLLIGGGIYAATKLRRKK